MSFAAGGVSLNLSSFREDMKIVVGEAPTSVNSQAKALLDQQAVAFGVFKKSLPPLPSYRQVTEATEKLKEMIGVLDNAIRTVTASYDGVMSKSPRTWRRLFAREQTEEASVLLERKTALSTQRNEASSMLMELVKQKVNYEESKGSLPSRELMITTAARDFKNEGVPESLDVLLNKRKVAKSDVESALLKFASVDAYSFLVETLKAHCAQYLDSSDKPKPYLTPKADETAARSLVISKLEDGGTRVEMTTTIGFTGKEEKTVIGQVTATLIVEHNADHAYSSLQAIYAKPILHDGIAHFADGQKVVLTFPKAKMAVQQAVAG